MPSRDPLHLYAPLRRRWEWMKREFKRRYPEDPQPFLTCTWRSLAEQAQEYAEGQGARPGQSLHNFRPAYAFDVAFDPNLANGIGNDATWDSTHFVKFGELAEELGLKWGGRFTRLFDGPHIQMPMTWEDAISGDIPKLEPIPVIPGGEEHPAENPWKVIFMDDNFHPDDPLVIPVPAGHDIVTRMDPVSRRLWIHVRSEE